MIAFVRRKAREAGATHLHTSVADAATSFDLISSGNPFHRLRRDAVARLAFRWLRPGGHLALLWSSTPWLGDAEWQSIQLPHTPSLDGRRADRVHVLHLLLSRLVLGARAPEFEADLHRPAR